jgi:hypothetical protein
MKQDLDLEAVLARAENQIKNLVKLNSLGRDEWMAWHVERHLLSGKLTSAWNNRAHFAKYGNGISWEEQYLRERVRLTFGMGAEPVSSSRLAIAKTITFEHGDNAMTETLWFHDVYNERGGSACVCVPVKVADVEYSTGEKRSGIALRLIFKNPEERPSWLPKSREVMAFTSYETIGNNGKIQSSVRNPGLVPQFYSASDEVLQAARREIEDHYTLDFRGWVAQKRISETLARNICLSREKATEDVAYCLTQSHYLHERAGSVWGYGFDTISADKIAPGHPLSEGDSDPHVQIGIYQHILATNNLFGDIFNIRHLKITDMWNNEKEGLGVVVEHAHRPKWINGRTVYAMVAEFNPKTKDFHPTINPC